MSYRDLFDRASRGLEDVDMCVRTMGMIGAKIEVPHDFFVEHEITPFGEQLMNRKSYLLTYQEFYDLAYRSKPKIRWKEVY